MLCEDMLCLCGLSWEEPRQAERGSNCTPRFLIYIYVFDSSDCLEQVGSVE